MTALIIVAVIGLLSTATAAWLGWAYGYRRGSEDTIAANDLAREGFLETMEQVSRR